KKYRLIKDYIIEKEKEIEKHNKNIEEDSVAVNIRRLSNVGIFRIYAGNYLKENDKISKDLTAMVRQLDPTSEGLPIEIYCFSNDIRWVYYEIIMSDIFDHLLTIVSEFQLEVFEAPSGSDLTKLTKK